MLYEVITRVGVGEPVRDSHRERIHPRPLRLVRRPGEYPGHRIDRRPGRPPDERERQGLGGKVGIGGRGGEGVEGELGEGLV